MRLKFNFRDGLHLEKHDIDKIKLWGTGEDIGDPVHAGVFVSQESALRLSVVYRCITLLSGTIASMPLDIVRKRDEVRVPVDRPPAWAEVPNPESNGYEFRERIEESMLMDGNAFLLITARDFQGFASEIWTLNPRRVQVRRRENSGRIYFLVDGQTEYSRYGSDNPLGDVLHIKLNSAGGVRGLSPIELARQSIGLGLATEKHGSKFFGRGQTMSGVIQLPASDRPKTKENIDLIRENWEAKHAGTDKAHRPGVLTGGATWQQISITNEEAQFLETRGFQVEDIASRIYGVPPHLVGLTEKQTSWGTGVEQQGIAFVRYTLMPHIVRLETALSSLLPRGQFVKLNQRELLRADSKTEAEVLNSQLERGVIDWAEYRALYDRPRRPGDNRRILLAGMQVLPPNGQPEPAPVTPPTTSSPNGNGNGQASLPLEVKE
jgi:HK97 family phage portal protein